VTIQFLKAHTMPDGSWHPSGKVMSLPEAQAEALIAEGIVKQRVPPGPTETKEQKEFREGEEGEGGGTDPLETEEQKE
jgi:hypothetical protein